MANGKDAAKSSPRSMRPSALLRLVNSTPLGEVIKHRQLYEHQNSGGLRIGDGKRIDLVRYAAWLFLWKERLEAAMAKKRKQAEKVIDDARNAGYEARKAAAGKRNLQMSAEGRDIGSIPSVRNRRRRKRAAGDFRYFCETYFPERFNLAWSDDHVKVIERIEMAVLRSGLFALAMPRGSGKTSLVECGVLWAVLYGLHQMAAGLGATKARGRELLESITIEIECNDMLMEDFPEVCYPVRCLEGIANRCSGQTSCGARTRITWTKDMLILPTIPDSAASGAIIKVGGLTGGDVRGMKHTRPDGRVVRPSLVLIDDPQTDKTARSATQNHTRLSLLSGAVLGMAGPDKRIAAVIPCTVIQPGDMADTILNPEAHPEWNGVRMALVYSFPDNEKLWAEYAEIRATGLRNGDEGRAATEFYRKHRAAMDAGAVVAWPQRYSAGELSAIQHAMNLKLRDETAFWAEYQNAPQVEHEEDDLLTAEEIAAKLNRRPARKVPTSCTKLAMYVDVQKKLLYYAVVAYEPNFTGYVIDYGSWPEQKARHFTYRSVRRTLLTAHRGKGEEAAIYAGLTDLVNDKVAGVYARDDGTQMRVGLCVIDAGYQKDTVELFIRQSRYAALLLPGKGLPVTASSIPLTERARKKGQEVGEDWRITAAQGSHSVRLALIDTNHWKSFTQARLSTPMGDAGCLSLFGKSATRHRMLAEQLTSEYRVRTEGRGRKLDEWKLPAHKPDNHLLDCVVGCCVAASMLGIRLLGKVVPTKRRRPAKKKKARYF